MALKTCIKQIIVEKQAKQKLSAIHHLSDTNSLFYLQHKEHKIN